MLNWRIDKQREVGGGGLLAVQRRWSLLGIPDSWDQGETLQVGRLQSHSVLSGSPAALSIIWAFFAFAFAFYEVCRPEKLPSS